jgi:hypothetical protein
MADAQYLGFIQTIIGRLAGNSFLLKGWTVTLVAGLSAFAKSDSKPSFAWIAVFVVAVFSVLDAYYLALEHAYRNLYDKAARQVAGGEWTLKADKVRLRDIARALVRPAVFLLHGAALAVSIAVAVSA